MKNMMRWWAVSGLVICLVACGGKQDTKPEPTAKPLPADSSSVAEKNSNADLELKISSFTPHDQTKIVMDTPDNTVKSWWEAYDQFQKFDQVNCMVTHNAYSKWQASNMGKLLTAEAFERFAGVSDCQVSTWKRQIDEVKSESETRAIVFSTIWPEEKPTEDADKDEVATAKAGTKVKYVLEKSAGKWTVSDVFRFEPQTSYRKEGWARMYAENKGKGKSYFIGTVYHQ